MSLAKTKKRLLARLRELRQNNYDRNMAAMKEFKANHRCVDCNRKYPEVVMEFATPSKPGEWSISRLAGSRCSLTELMEAMEKTDVLCSNCKRIRDSKLPSSSGRGHLSGVGHKLSLA